MLHLSRWILFGSLTFTACVEAPRPEPEIASSSKHGGYAMAFAAQLNASVTEFNDRQNTARKAMAAWNGYASALKDPNWFHVIEIVDAADQDGRGYAYVERIRQVDGAHTFYESEKDEPFKHVR